MTTDTDPELSDDTVRERLAKDAAKDYAMISGALKRAIAGEKEVWVTCKNCKHRSAAQVPDYTAMMRAVDVWMNHGFGRFVESGDDRRQREEEERRQEISALSPEQVAREMLRRVLLLIDHVPDTQRREFVKACGFVLAEDVPARTLS